MRYNLTIFNINHVELLKFDDIPSVLEMHKQVLDDLPKEAKQFLKPKDRAALSRHLKTDMPILGVRDPKTGKVIATTLLCFPDKYKTVAEYRKNIGGYPLGLYDKSKVMILQNMAVRPEFQGRGYIRDMFHIAAIMAVDLDRTNLIAKVHRDNSRSQKIFRDAGFMAYSTSIARQNCDKHDYFHGDAYTIWNTLTNGELRLYDVNKRLTMK